MLNSNVECPFLAAATSTIGRDRKLGEKLVHLLLYTDAPPVDDIATRFGGLPLVPALSQFQWPCCATCNGAMQFLGQITLSDGDTKRLMLLFMCQNNPGLCDEWEANSGGNHAVVLTITGPMRLADAPNAGVIQLNTVYGAQVEVHEATDYDNARLEWEKENPGQQRQVLGQIEGRPSWLQMDESPVCDDCGNGMLFAVQLEEGPDHKTSMNFGGGGCAYVFRCRCNQQSAKFLWQC
jgi:hypothetical protein